MVTVMIKAGDDGQVTVGVMPAEMMAMHEGKEMGAMQPAQSVDDALQMAKDLLTNPQSEQGPTQAPGGGMMMGKMGPQDQMWSKVSQDRKAMM